MFQGYLYSEENLERIKAQISEIRDRFDLPFDELYHKEKKLVDAVIRATAALRSKEANLPDPMGADRTYSPGQLMNEYHQEELQAEHQFVRDQRKKSK
jgi:hypothetical protein